MRLGGGQLGGWKDQMNLHLILTALSKPWEATYFYFLLFQGKLFNSLET